MFCSMRIVRLDWRSDSMQKPLRRAKGVQGVEQSDGQRVRGGLRMVVCSAPVTARIHKDE